MIGVNGTRKNDLACAKAQKPDFADINGTIYFITCNLKDFPIKIGWTADMKSRLQGLQTGLPHKVIVLATIAGTPDYEQSLHISFNEHRLEGEWFKRHPDLMEFIHLQRTKDMWL